METVSQLTQKADGTRQSDLLRKGFCFGNSLAISLISSKPDLSLSAKARLPKESKDTHAWARLQRKAGEATFTCDLSSKSEFKAVSTFNPESNASLQLQLELTKNLLRHTTSWSMNVEHGFAHYCYRLAMLPGPSFTYAAVVGGPSFGLGVDLSYDWAPSLFTAYSGLVYFGGRDSRCVFKYESGRWDTNLAFVCYRRMSPLATFALKLAKSQEGHYTSEAGLRMEYSPTRMMTVKISSDGVLSYASRQRLWENVSLLYSVEIATGRGKPMGVQTGVKIKINS